MTVSSSRRRFGGLLAGAALVPSAAQAADKNRFTATPKTLLKPARLREGDKVALITPSGVIAQKMLDTAQRNLASLGLQGVVGKNALAQFGLYGGTVQQRLEDLHWAFADPEIRGIWCVRGGSGGISLLDQIDYALIKKNPKAFIGYSDTTVFHLAFLRKLGLVCFHAPVATSTFPAYAREHFRQVLMQPAPTYRMENAMENHVRAITRAPFRSRSIRPGSATGRLTGGCLSMVAALEGTPYAAELKDRLLFLEDVNEPPYKIDRWLTQLHLARDFNAMAGLMLGVFDNCEAPNDGEPALTLTETFDYVLSPLRIPVVSGYSVGHIADQMVLPLGVMARLESDTQSLTLLEPAVL